MTSLRKKRWHQIEHQFKEFGEGQQTIAGVKP